MSLLLLVYLLIGAAALVAVIASFFVRRHGEQPSASRQCQPTDEVFIDPTTGRRMRVWVDPREGSRHYVEDSGPH